MSHPDGSAPRSAPTTLLAPYLMVFFGGQAAGALAWGAAAESLGTPLTLLLAAAGLALALLPAAARFRLGTFEKLDLSPSRHWPALAPTLVAEHERDDRPVLVTIAYRVEPARAAEFREAICALRSERLRDGALRWELFRDPLDPARYVEHFVSPSWVEHLRHHERVTAADRALEERVAALHTGEERPRVSHFVGEVRR